MSTRGPLVVSVSAFGVSGFFVGFPGYGDREVKLAEGLAV
jgi:hypothetical protein